MTTNPGGQTIGSGADTAISWTEVAFDTDGMFNAAQPTRLTCVRAGFYYLTGNCFWDANAVGVRRIRARVNGGAFVLVGASQMAVTTAGVGTDQNVPKAVWEAAIGDFVELVARQDSGGNLRADYAVTIFEVSAGV